MKVYDVTVYLKGGGVIHLDAYRKFSLTLSDLNAKVTWEPSDLSKNIAVTMDPREIAAATCVAREV